MVVSNKGNEMHIGVWIPISGGRFSRPLGKIGKNVLFPENSGSLKTTHDIEDTPSLAPKAKSITINLQGKSNTLLMEGSLDVKLPTTWTDEKVEVGRSRKEKGRRKKIREEKGAEPFGEMRDQQWPDCNKLPEGFSSN
jgi:hypothetical protein